MDLITQLRCPSLHYLNVSLIFFLLQHNRVNEGMDINLTGVWERNITGQGVTVVVVDDGVEHTHQDIQPNYVSQRDQRSAVIAEFFWEV